MGPGFLLRIALREDPLKRRVAILLAFAITVAWPTAAHAESVRANELTSKLRVRTERNTGYDRSLFTHWSDADGDGCDTRAEVLMIESRTQVRKTSSCTVLSGRWLSVFDGRTWRQAGDVDIDHHIALAEAWGSGAHVWTATDRMRFANDLGYPWSLNAMTDNLNASKSDRDPNEWLPPTRVCGYVTKWALVKYRWRLAIDAAERTAIEDVLSGDCGRQRVRLPKRMRLGVGGGGGGNCDPSYPTVCIPPPPPDLDCGQIAFRNFTVVGDDPHGFDGNNDSVGCES